MKKILFVTAFIISVIFSFVSLSFSLDNTVKYNRLAAKEKNNNSAVRVRLTKLEAEKECFVILREYDGVIGIYDKNEKNLLGTINVPVKTLPELDRRSLLDGIEVKDSDKFISLFQDFSE